MSNRGRKSLLEYRVFPPVDLSIDIDLQLSPKRVLVLILSPWSIFFMRKIIHSAFPTEIPH